MTDASIGLCPACLADLRCSPDNGATAVTTLFEGAAGIGQASPWAIEQMVAALGAQDSPRE